MEWSQSPPQGGVSGRQALLRRGGLLPDGRQRRRDAGQRDGGRSGVRRLSRRILRRRIHVQAKVPQPQVQEGNRVLLRARHLQPVLPTRLQKRRSLRPARTLQVPEGLQGRQMSAPDLIRQFDP